MSLTSHTFESNKSRDAGGVDEEAGADTFRATRLP
jgi:hypothetical protein